MSLDKLALCALGLAVVLAAVESDAQENPVVIIETSLGNITVQLDPARAPKSVENFLAYVKEGFYDGTIFHRVIRGFMIQGGGFAADMQRKATRPPIKNEANNKLANKRGTIAMARLPEPHSATSQFFINTKDNPGLDFKGQSASEYGYAVFGMVIDGMDVVDQIEKVKTTSRAGYDDVPAEPVIIKTIRLKTP